MPAVTVNGERYEAPRGERNLLSFLRFDLGLTGAKYGCGEGLCGACTVLVDGQPIRSCLSTVGAVAGGRILTIEGLAGSTAAGSGPAAARPSTGSGRAGGDAEPGRADGGAGAERAGGDAGAGRADGDSGPERAGGGAGADGPAAADVGALHPVQRAFVEEQAMQCGYCIPGFIMTSVALLERERRPSAEQIREALGEHICRCGTYQRIQRAVERAALTP